MSASVSLTDSKDRWPLGDRLDFYSIPEPNSGCHLWLGATDQHGYGRLYWKGRLWIATRANWVDKRGPIPDGMIVCHKCDVPACINPDHLFLGTRQDNMTDMVRKGRQSRGDSQNIRRGGKCSWAKLATDDVIRIRRDARPNRVVAAEFNVSRATISAIRTRRLWAHVPVEA